MKDAFQSALRPLPPPLFSVFSTCKSAIQRIEAAVGEAGLSSSLAGTLRCLRAGARSKDSKQGLEAGTRSRRFCGSFPVRVWVVTVHLRSARRPQKIKKETNENKKHLGWESVQRGFGRTERKFISGNRLNKEKKNSDITLQIRT